MAKQNKPNPSLLLEKKPIEFVKPSKHTPWETLSLSTLDNDPINEVMYAMLYVFKANENNRNDPVSLLRKSLSELLVYYYPLSSKLSRRKCDRKLQLTNHSNGVPFVMATATCDLSNLNYIENIYEDIALNLVPEIELNYEYEISYHPLALQVTKFPCGGFTIGAALSHAVFDGFGVAMIMHALTELAGGKSEPSVMPVWQRERLLREIDNIPARVPGSDCDGHLAKSPYMPSDDMVTETINITPENIKKLKDNLVREEESLKEGFTTFEVLSAYLWKSRSRALKLNLDGITVLGIAVGIRHVLDPPVPKGYYGNSYIDVYIELTVKKLDESSISDIVKLVKRAKKQAYDKTYVEDELRNTERLMKEDVKFEGVRDSLFFMTGLRNIGLFGSMDFGWNEPVNVRPLTPPRSAKNLGMILKPSELDPSMEGGVKIVMTLPREAMINFKQEMHILCLRNELM